jgi:hypothetical protein
VRSITLRLPIALSFLLAASGTARADVCVVIDEARDTLPAGDRPSSLLLVARQFEREGEHVVPDPCPARYTVSHIALGDTIFVTISGPSGRREGTALGTGDLPALYSQMVRSIVTGRPMKGFNVIDRTNVTAAQATAERVRTDSLWYARMGYGSVFGDRTYGSPSIGFGYRAELDSFGIDVSFLNFLMKSGTDYYSGGDDVFAGSLLKLEGLYFLNHKENTTTYVGGGLSWGGTGFGGGWHGSGLQGEFTVGYELPRASTIRIFLQGDAVLPFYNVSTVRYSGDFRRPTITTESRYAPSLVVSVGLGWQRDRTSRRAQRSELE